MLTRVRGGPRIAVAVGLLACFGSQGLWASTSPEPALTVHRSTRAVPHRFTVHPDGATVPANQTQRFEVTDAQGKPVAVHWNVSGIGCFGAACGTIDKQGVYRTPSSLPQPRVVILEAVVVADPNYSVLTQVRLEDAATAPVSPPSAQVAAGKTQPLTAPVVGRQNVVQSPDLPLPSAVAAAPVVGRQSVAHNTELPALPSAVAAAPVVGRQSVAHNAELPALPSAVAAAPVVKKQNIARKIELPLLLGAAPAVGQQNVARSTELPPLPHAVAAAPAVGQQNVARSTEVPPLPHEVAAAPAVGQQTIARIELPSLPYAVAAAPAVGRQNVARSSELPSLPGAVAAGPAVGRQNVARSAVLPQLSDEGAAARVGTVVGTARSPVVTYQGGQLTIDAETLTLAEVLKLVAEKTGAEIDVPSGSGLDRIIEHAGPGRAEDVLASLLNGSPFDFVIVSSPQPPHDPTQVLLFLHRTDTPAIDQTVSASAKPTTPSSPVLFKPPTTSVLFTPPANASSASVVAPPPLVMGAPAEPIPPEVREQMMRDFSRQLRGQPPQ
ncbi:MAG TPA: hypothetical protein VJX30_13995 [Terriglobales bacterium]|nr:hypothetical protein [Terriglobales bacterium]